MNTRHQNSNASTSSIDNEVIPPAPQFCKRISTEEMDKQSKEATKKELVKLSSMIGGVASSPSHTEGAATASKHDFKDPDKEIYMMLFQCMDRLQTMSANQCLLSEKYSKATEESLTHKKELDDKKNEYEKELDQLSEEKNHYESLCEDYEQELQTLKQEKTRATNRIIRYENSLSNYRFFTFMMNLIYLLLLLFMMEYNQQSQDLYQSAKNKFYQS